MIVELLMYLTMVFPESMNWLMSRRDAWTRRQLSDPTRREVLLSPFDESHFTTAERPE